MLIVSYLKMLIYTFFLFFHWCGWINPQELLVLHGHWFSFQIIYAAKPLRSSSYFFWWIAFLLHKILNEGSISEINKDHFHSKIKHIVKLSAFFNNQNRDTWNHPKRQIYYLEPILSYQIIWILKSYL